jgi:hypothetical protein
LPPPANPLAETRGRFRLTTGRPFAVYNIVSTRPDAAAAIDPADLRFMVDGVACGRIERHGQDGSLRIIVPDRQQSGGCGYEGATVLGYLHETQVSSLQWRFEVRELSISPAAGRARQVPGEPVIRPPSVGDGGLVAPWICIDARDSAFLYS